MSSPRSRRPAQRVAFPGAPCGKPPKRIGVDGKEEYGRRYERFQRPSVGGLDLSLLRAFPRGDVRTDLGIEASNVFNRTTRCAPARAFSPPGFMEYTPGWSLNDPQTVRAGRRVQL